MTENEEVAYVLGFNAAHREYLQAALRNLGDSIPDRKAVAWEVERLAAIAQLRKLCEQCGDNDWTDNLHLADVIEKHLGRHLQALAAGAEGG